MSMVRMNGAVISGGYRLHPLHSVEYVCKYIESTGEYFQPERRTGRSTRQALNFIAEAMGAPGCDIRVHDHHGTHEACKHLMRMIEDMTTALQFEHFTFNYPQCTLRFG